MEGGEPLRPVSYTHLEIIAELHRIPTVIYQIFIERIGRGIAKEMCIRDSLRDELAVWEKERNSNCSVVNWQFHTKDARIKLVSLYPDI